MSDVQSAESSQNEFWSLLDRSFTNLYSPVEFSQKEHLVESIGKVITDLKDWVFLLQSNCTSLYIWAIQHFSQLLLNTELTPLHEKISLCLSKLIGVLGASNHVLFNGVIKTFNFILECILSEMDEISTNVSSYIPVSQEVVVPDWIRNKFPVIEITKMSSFSSIFRCFIEVCNQNADALLMYSKCHIIKTIINLSKILDHSKDKNGLKVLFLFASRSLPLLTIKAWRNICLDLKAVPNDTETHTAFGDLLQIFSCMPNNPEVNFLLLTTAVDLLPCLCSHSSPDIEKWIHLATKLLDLLPGYYIKHLDITGLLPHSPSNAVICDLFLSYMIKSVDYFILTEELTSDKCTLSEIDDVWELLMNSLNLSVETALSDLENRLYNLENVLRILTVAMKMKPYLIKYDVEITLFDLVTDRIFNLFLLVDRIITSSEVEIISNLIKLSKISIFIMKEKGTLEPGSFRSLFKFLSIPWDEDSLTIWGELKPLCFDGLLSIFIGSLNLKEKEFSYMIAEYLFIISSKEESYLVPFVHSLLIAITCLPVNLSKLLHDNFLTECVNPATVGKLFKNSCTREILPCFYSGCCKVEENESGMVLLCEVCDLKSKMKESHKPLKGNYLNFIGLNFIKLIMEDKPRQDLNDDLLRSLGRYIFHIPEIRSDLMSECLTEFLGHRILKVDFNLTCVLKQFLFDTENIFQKDKANLVSKTLLNVFTNNPTYTNQKWRIRFFEFLLFTSRFSKDFLWTSCKFLISLVNDDPTLSIEVNYMKQELVGALRFHKMEMKILLILYEKELSKIIVDLIIQNIQNCHGDVGSTMAYVASLFDMKPRVLLEYRCTPYMIAYILMICDLNQTKYLISRLSQILLIRVKDVITKGFHIIFSTVYFIDDEICSVKALSFIEVICGCKIDALVYYAYKNLICYIMMNCHKPLKVGRFFQSYALDGQTENPASILLKFAVGFLTFVDAKLSSQSSSSYMIRSCIRSIPSLIQVLGSEHVISIRIKLLATLRTGLPQHYESYPKECLEAWTYFIYSIELPFLGPYLTTIFTLLEPLFAIYPLDISKMFHYLVVKNGHLYLDYVPELFFIEDSKIPEMHAVWQNIQQANKKKSTVSILYKTLEHIRNGAVESRLHSLEYMFHLLKVKRHEILKMIHQNDQLHSVFKEIIDCLMLNIHYGNMEVKMLCANCIGEIGAINPARFGYGHTNDQLTKCFSIASKEFAYFIILELTRSLQKSVDSLSYNTIASSIQELLKLYFPSGDVEEIQKFLQTFPHNEFTILSSMLGSRYIFTESVVMKRRHEKLGSNAGKNTFEWASSWASELIALIPSESTESIVFKTSLPAIQLDSEALEAVLPHILLHTILMCSEEDKTLVEMELKFILKFQEQNLLIRPQEINLFKSSSKKAANCFSSEITEEKCVAIILDIIDFLYQYYSHLKVSKSETPKLRIISEFLSKFPSDFISLKSYMLKDYCRSLFYLERRLSSSTKVNNITPLKNIYAKLNDSDGLLGVIRASNCIPTTEEIMLNHIVCGNIQDALPGYELLATKNPNSAECNRALIQCFLNINSPCVAMKLADSFFNESTDCFAPAFCSELVEAAWKSLMFHDLKEQVKSFDDKMKNNWSWSIDIGLAYLDFSNLEFDCMKKKTTSIRGYIAERLAAISNTTIGAYRQGYSHIVNLHILNDLEKYADSIGFINKPEATSCTINKYFDDLNMDFRMQLLPSNGYYISNLLSSRLQVLSMINNMKEKCSLPLNEFIASELGNCYLKAAKIARKNSNFQLAHSYLALAEEYKPRGLFIEKAKLHKCKFETDLAICVLKQGIQQHSEPSNTVVESTLRKLSAQAKLLIARYNEQNMNVDYNEGTRAYRDAITTFANEKNYRCLAQYLYQIHSTDKAPDSTNSKCDIQVEAMKCFGLSLRYGCKYIYQSMFCMISLWLDFGTRFSQTLEATKDHPRLLTKSHDEVMNKLNTLMQDHFQNLPTYMFMAVFSQLLSRINHPLPSCQKLLIEIISQVAVDFPQQALWMMAPIWKSDDAAQARLFKDIFLQMKNREPTLNQRRGYSIAKLFRVFHDLVDIFIGICSKQSPTDRLVFPLKKISQKLQILLKTSDVSIMIPSQKLRTIFLPNVKHFECQETSMQHNPFPFNMVYFSDVDEKVQVLTSLQRPKKLVFTGSDGLKYPIMFKPMDDLRLDSRIMEFCSVINMYLQRDPASCDRNLHIKTYSVVPLNQQNGLIEWVPNMLGLRTILVKMFEMKGSNILKVAQVKAKMEACKSPQEKLKLFEEVLLPQHPPILHKWFFQQFPSPDSWYLARKSFVRTAAVMSIVGYVVGLGDRHFENILLDLTTGDIMHVDYNCLFGRGESLVVPECVPFRLTQNMVKAMGSTGIEGHFMKSCEITTRVIRNHSDQLLYVLKPFLYDPNIQLNPKYPNKTKEDIITIQKKMSGCVIARKKKTQALSVDGQVRCLISEATSHQNLSQMFYGWLPHF